MQLSLTCNRARLQRACAIAKVGIASRQSLPILTYAMLTADAGGLRLDTTDLGSAWRAYLPAAVAVPGCALVPLAQLADAVKGKGDATVAITWEVGASCVKVASGGIETSLTPLPVEDWPVLPSVADGGGARVTFGIRTDVLRQLVGQTAPFAARDDARPILECCHLSVGQSADMMIVHASDGFRMTATSAPLETAPDDDVLVAVPASALKALVKLLPKSDDRLDVYVAEEGALFEVCARDLTLTVRTTEAKPPAYDNLIPTTTAWSLGLDTAALLGAVTAALPAARWASGVLRFTPTDDGVTLSAGAAGGGPQFSAAVHCAVIGEPVEFAVNAQYVADYLRSSANGRMAVEGNSASSPLLFTQPDAPNYRHIIMPMHIAR